MASTYSPSLKLELIGDGDQSGTWGNTTNNNLGTLLEQSITGVQSITMANADYTLSNFNGVADESRNAVLVVTGTNSAIRQVICPLVEKIYIVYNNTTGGFAITIGGVTGATITIPNGVTAQVYCDGTNFFSSQTGSAGNFTVNGTLIATGNETVSGTLGVTGATTLTGATTVGSTLGVTGATTLTSNATIGGTLGVTGATTLTGNTTVTGTLGVTGATNLTTGSISGVVTAPTATLGTNTTQLATTAFVLANGGASSVAGGFVSVQYFTTAGSFTWTRPSGIKKIYVYVIGGGGGGLTYNGSPSTGGGGGGCAIKMLDVTSISTAPVVVGLGGAPSVVGAPSIFNSTITGNGGGVGSNGGGYPVGGAGGTATGGDLNIPGGQASGIALANSVGGTGGVPSFFGVAGAGAGYVSAGTAGVYGGGGGGAGYVAGATSGGDGIIVVYEYN